MNIEESDLSAALPALEKFRLQALILRTEPAHMIVTFKQKFTVPLQIHMHEPPYVYPRKQETATLSGLSWEDGWKEREKKINNAEI